MKKEKIVGGLMLIYMIITTIASLIIIFHKEYNQYDVNHDGKVSAADYIAIRNYIMQK